MSQEDSKTIHCQLPTEAAVYMAYMPFVLNGGFFVRTPAHYILGETLNIQLNFLTETETYSSTGVVVWITPQGAQGLKPAGVGVQLTGANAAQLKNKFETILTGMLKSSQFTDTM